MNTKILFTDLDATLLDDTKNISKFFLGIDNQELIDLAIESGFDGGVEEML